MTLIAGAVEANVDVIVVTHLQGSVEVPTTRISEKHVSWKDQNEVTA